MDEICKHWRRAGETGKVLNAQYARTGCTYCDLEHAEELLKRLIVHGLYTDNRGALFWQWTEEVAIRDHDMELEQHCREFIAKHKLNEAHIMLRLPQDG